MSEEETARLWHKITTLEMKLEQCRGLVRAAWDEAWAIDPNQAHFYMGKPVDDQELSCFLDWESSEVKAQLPEREVKPR